MTTATFPRTNAIFSLFARLAPKPRAALQDEKPSPLEEARADVLRMIDEGYTNPETGEHHELPPYARAQCRAAINGLYWT